MHLTTEQSTSSAASAGVATTWPVSPPTTTTATPAHTPMTTRQYVQEPSVSGRLRTVAAYRPDLAIRVRGEIASGAPDRDPTATRTIRAGRRG